MKRLLLFAALLQVCFVSAQLSFCNGSKGDPIFTENFGSGTTFLPQLPAGTTTYNFTNGSPDDGSYTTYYRMNPNATWHNAPDHTPDDQPDGTDGKALIVNAGFTAGEFYSRQVTGLCVNTTFEFTAWVMNIYNASSGQCPGTGIPIDVTFEIWDSTETNLLKSGSTGPIDGTSTPLWQQFGLVFTTLPGQTSIVLKMKNNGQGGCGNDLAIDDIMFRSCGDPTTISTAAVTGTTYKVCQDDLPVNITLDVNISNATPHVFQWQESADNISFTDIAGATGMSYTPGPISTTTYFRVKVAQDAANLANPFCFTVSEPFSVIAVPQPTDPVSNGDKTICDNDPIPALSVTPDANSSIRWFDAATGGNLLVSGSNSYQPAAAGTFYAEAFLTDAPCVSQNRTAVTLTINQATLIPQTGTDPILFCEGSSVTLDAGVFGVSYDWQPGGETTKYLRVTTAGTYTLTITNSSGCTDSKSFVVQQIDAPVIASITNEVRTITVMTTAPGNFEYSIDGILYQDSNVFLNVSGGQHTFYVRGKTGCGFAQQDFFLLVVPDFFTPNGDGYNDVFKIPGFAQIPATLFYIFDRYGRLICALDRSNDSWDGNLNGQPLPADDYWYKMFTVTGQEIKGHFALKR